MKPVSITLLSFCCLLMGINAHGATGSLDLTFDADSINGYGVFSGCVQPNGKILIAGNFENVNNLKRQGIARFESDGRLDESFDPGPILNTAFYSISNPVVYSVALQPDGRIIVGGGFTNINGINRNNIARLNSDGSVDASFNPGTGTDYNVYRVVLQSDGRILISGGFVQVDGVARQYFARLNSDGSLDVGFNPNTGFVYDAAVQPDGKIIVVGDVTARLNPDGSVDSGFTADRGVTGSSVALQLDGKILVGGSSVSISVSNLSRLNSDGSRDLSFRPEIATTGGSLLREFLLQPDGRILVSSSFVSADNHLHGVIARMNPDGSSDGNFTPCTVLGFAVPVALQPDSKVIIGGSFSTVNGTPCHAVARLLGDAPVIITQPVNQTNVVGTTATFTVIASGTPVLLYQWYRDGVALTDSAQIAGTMTATLTLKHAQFHDAAAYTVVVSNDVGSVTTDSALFRVITPSTARKRPISD